jgi:hypothetical protein
VHPSDWRNIPACVVSTSSYLLEKQNSFEKEFKNFIAKQEYAISKVNDRLLKVQSETSNSISAMSTALSRGLEEMKYKQKVLTDLVDD